MIQLPADDTAAARAVEDRRRLEICDQIEALIVTVRDRHPALPIAALAPFLEEPQRSRLLELLDQAQDFVSYPLHEER